jgi:hypothetical protein
VPSQAAVLAPPPSILAGRFRRPTNCATNKKSVELGAVINRHQCGRQ